MGHFGSEAREERTRSSWKILHSPFRTQFHTWSKHPRAKKGDVQRKDFQMSPILTLLLTVGTIRARLTQCACGCVAVVGPPYCQTEQFEPRVKTNLNKFGKLDSLINNAGVISGGLLADAPIEEYDRLFNTNVRSVIQLTKLALPHLIATKGTIVNVSSVFALVSQVNYGYYSMTKSALDAYTKILAVEMAPHGVRVNSVNPGYVETPIFDTVGMTEEQKKETFEYAKKTHALGRMGNADEVAKAIFFLAGPDSSFTTGDILKVDGGFVLVRP